MDDIVPSVIAVIGILVVLYAAAVVDSSHCFPVIVWFECLTRTYSYWKHKGVPFVKPVILFGSYGFNWDKHQGFVELKWCEKYGRIFGIYEGRKPVLIVAEPELLKLIFIRDFQIFNSPRDLKFGDPIVDLMLVSVEGEEWKRMRNIMAPIFSSGKIKRMSYLLKDCAEALKNNFLDAVREDREIECGRYFGAFTLDVIARCAFGTILDTYHDVDNPFVQGVRHLFSRRSWRVTFAFCAPRLAKLIKLSLFSPEITRFFRDVILKMVDERKQTGIKKNDFLQLLLDAEEEETPSFSGNMANKQENRRRTLSLDEIVAQCILFILAGYHTTTNTLILTAHNLAHNPGCQEQLIREIDEKLKGKEEIDYDVINEMTYLEAVINETLRCCCPVPRIERRAAQNCYLGDTEIVIPKGMMVAVPAYAMHHNPEWYPNPEKYTPERFLPENKSSLVPYTFYPFGAGPRNCLGRRFAMMEMKFCLVNLLRHVRFKKCCKTKARVEYYGGQGLHRPKDVIIKAEERF